MMKLKKKEIVMAAASLALGGVITIAFLFFLFTSTRIPSIITALVIGPFGLTANILTKVLPSQMGATSDGLPTTAVFLPSLIINSMYLGGIIIGATVAISCLLKRRNTQPRP